MTPLLLGMVVCLLLLGAGVTAATSVFLARQRLQSACDGAAAAAADADRAGYYRGGGDQTGGGVAQAAAARYLARRQLPINVTADSSTGSVVVICSGESEITLGALFGVPSMTQSVRSVGRPVL